MRFTIYVSKEFEIGFKQFVKNQESPSRRICNMVSRDLDNLNIPLLRKCLLKSPSELNRVRELLKEF